MAISTVTCAGSAKADLQPNQSVLIPVVANDLAYSNASQKLYVTVGAGEAGNKANSILGINPVNGQLANPVSIGTEPNLLEAGSDGQYLYASFDHDTKIRRFDTQTNRAGAQWELLMNGAEYPASVALDLDAVPGAPESIAVTGELNSYFNNLAIYDKGVIRPKVYGATYGLTNIAFAGPNTIFGHSSGDDTVFQVAPDGVTLIRKAKVMDGTDNKVVGRGANVFTERGLEIDVASLTVKGTFEVDFSFEGPVIRNGRAFFVSKDGIAAFDRATYRKIGFFPVASFRPRALTTWGTDGFAWLTDEGVMIARSNIATRPIPAAAPLPGARTVRAGVRAWDFATSDLIYDKVTNRLVASLPPSLGANGNSLAVLNPRAGSAEMPLYIGSSPGKLALSDNGVSLYVGLDGAYSVRRVNLPERRPLAIWPLGFGYSSGFQANDLEVLPQRNDAVAVALRHVGVSPAHAGVAIFSQGRKLPQVTAEHTGSPVIEFAGPGVLWGYNSDTTEFGIRRLAVNETGVKETKVISDLLPDATDFQFAEGKIYADNGYIIDTVSETAAGPLPGILLPDTALGKVFVLNHYHGLIQVHDINTHQLLGTIEMPEAKNAVGSFVRWGVRGLAFRTAQKIWLIENDLVASAVPGRRSSSSTPF